MPDGSKVGDPILFKGSIRDYQYELLSVSFKAMGGGIWDYDVNTGHLYCDDRWHEILGVKPGADRINSIESFRPFIHPEDVERVTTVDEGQVQALLEQNQSYAQEFRIVRPDGEVRWLRSAACIVRDPQSGHVRAIGCVIDFTEFRASDITVSGEVASISAKERECLMWVSVGKTAWETAVILGRSPRTVEFHLANAARKLGAGSKMHAAAIAIRQGLL